MKKIAALLSIITLLAVALLWHYYPTYRNNLYEEKLDDAARRLTERLTLQEKVGQLFHIGLPGEKMGEQAHKIFNKIKPGGVILFAYNLKNESQISNLITEMNDAAQNLELPQLFISIDQEGGRVFRLPEGVVTQFPGAMALGQVNNLKQTAEVAFITAYELRKKGINLLLAPVLDVNNNPKNPVINTRSFGYDPQKVARLGGAFIDGVQSANVVATAKHFPGHGNTFTDSHLALPRIERNLKELEEIELIPFRAAINKGVDVIMSAHILYAALDRERPATLSRAILNDFLREELKFKGLIMTDAMEMDAIDKNWSSTAAVRMAFEAGADVILLTGADDYAIEMYNALHDDFKSGKLSTELLDRRVERNYRLKLKRDLFALPNGDDAELAAELNWLREYNRDRQQNIDEQYQTLQSECESLNGLVSRAAISSLGIEFQAIATTDLKNIRLRSSSSAMESYGRKKGVSTLKLEKGAWSKALSAQKVDSNEIWMVEVDEKKLSDWKKLVESYNRLPDERRPRQLIALYTGNPYLNPPRPRGGAVLVSFSPTSVSRRALLKRALSGETIPKAELASHIEKAE